MAKKVLIADDEPNIVTALEFMLQKSGYEVHTVNNGTEALNQIEQFGPHLVLLDVMMPAINGYEVCQRIRQNPALAGLKIIMLTAKGRELDMAKGLALGADVYVTKPFATKQLLEQVQKLIGPLA
jgi:two-component system, OmpR family, alkaline phosphatase synthesis response regulator PhoP